MNFCVIFPSVSLLIKHVIWVTIIRICFFLICRNGAIAVDHREEVRRRVEHENEDIVRRAVCRPSRRVLSRKVNGKLGRLADLQVYVASEVEAVIGEVAVVAGLRILLEHAVLLLISGGDEILRVLRATPEIEGVSLSVNGLCNQIRPL